jgi:hypothetical protein
MEEFINLLHGFYLMRRQMGKLFVLIFLLASQFITAQREEIIVPNGLSLISGNSINQNAWKSAYKIKIDNYNEIYFVHDGQFFYFGFRGIYEPWSHLYINNRSNVNVLHVTAAMGRVIYNVNHYGTWQPDRQFNWKMKNTKHDFVINNNVDEKSFLEKEGWITAVNSTSDKKEVVFKIAIKNLDVNNLHLAWVYGLKENSYLHWPTNLNDDTLKPEVFTGYNPSDLKFNFKSWALLKLSK